MTGSVCLQDNMLPSCQSSPTFDFFCARGPEARISALFSTNGHSHHLSKLVFFLQGSDEVPIALVEMGIKPLACAKASQPFLSDEWGMPFQLEFGV